MVDMIKAASDYVRDGLPGVPLCWPTPEGKCGCGGGHTGKQIGKAPLIKDWVNNATREVPRVLALWDKHPDANIGILTDGLVVLDFDPEHGGFFSCFDRQGTLYDTTKYVWLQGRFVWMFARIYNSVEEPRPEWLEASRRGVE